MDHARSVLVGVEVGECRWRRKKKTVAATSSGMIRFAAGRGAQTLMNTNNRLQLLLSHRSESYPLALPRRKQRTSVLPAEMLSEWLCMGTQIWDQGCRPKGVRTFLHVWRSLEVQELFLLEGREVARSNPALNFGILRFSHFSSSRQFPRDETQGARATTWEQHGCL